MTRAMTNKIVTEVRGALDKQVEDGGPVTYTEARTGMMEAIEKVVRENLRTFTEGLCPPGSLLLRLEEGDDDSAPYRVAVVAGPMRWHSVSLNVQVKGIQHLSMAVSEFASEFDGAMTPGQALAAYGEALDRVLAAEAWENRVGSATPQGEESEASEVTGGDADCG